MKKLVLILAALLVCVSLLPALSESSIPNPVAAESREDFIGEWELSGASMIGFYMSASELGYSAQLTVTESSITIVTDEDTGISVWDVLDDGTLQYTDPDGTTGIFTLNDDGTLSTITPVTVEGQNFDLTLYFAKAPQA